MLLMLLHRGIQQFNYRNHENNLANTIKQHFQKRQGLQSYRPMSSHPDEVDLEIGSIGTNTSCTYRESRRIERPTIAYLQACRLAVVSWQRREI
jgi:hypothetical protein